MFKFLAKFRKCESGAVSTDWVVITAAIMLFAVAISATIKTSATNAGAQIGTDVAAMATP